MKETWFVFDVESSGPYPPAYSMLSIGVVKLTRSLDITFYSEMATLPDSDYDEKAMEVNGLDWEKHISGRGVTAIQKAVDTLEQWILDCTNPGTRPVAVSDNPAFDWQWLNYYMHSFVGENPFGWSARRIGDMWHGLASVLLVDDCDMPKHWHELRQTEHTHNALDDAKSNASALIEMANWGLEVPGL